MKALDASGEIIRGYARKPIPITTKSDGTFVTCADRQAEQVIRNVLLQERPSDGIIGEEFDPIRPEAPFVWVIDPIDGTKAFITGRPSFVTLIALLEHGHPILGAIDQPILNDRWLASQGSVTTWNGIPISTRQCDSLDQAIASASHPEMFARPDTQRAQNVTQAVRLMIYGGDGYAYGLVATGLQDMVIEADLKLHDYMAMRPIIEGAGGIITDWSGRTIDYHSDGRIVASGDRRVHEQALSLLNQA